MITILFSFLFCIFQTDTKDSTDIDISPYVRTVINDFFKRKDAKESNVFSLLIREIRISNKDVIGITVLPEDSAWKFLLSNADSLGSAVVSIKYEEHCGKLFYWDVKGNTLTQDVYEKLMEYNFIERRDVPDQRWLLGERGYFQDGKKNLQYFFVKGNHKNFKRKYQSVYSPPKRM